MLETILDCELDLESGGFMSLLAVLELREVDLCHKLWRKGALLTNVQLSHRANCLSSSTAGLPLFLAEIGLFV